MSKQHGSDPWKRLSMDTIETPPAAEGEIPSPMENARKIIREAELRERSELVAKIDQARREGHAAGFAEGIESAKADAAKEGFSQGYEEGLQAGERELREKTSQVLNPIRNLAANFSEALKSIDAEIGELLVELSLKIGNQLAIDHIKASPEAVLAVVKAVLHSDPELIGKPRLRVNPLDLEMIKKEFGDEIEALGWSLIPDDEISRGGCKVISKTGEIDASWDTRWANILAEYNLQKGS